jgi:transcription antitermination factor NusA-like protein
LQEEEEIKIVKHIKKANHETLTEVFANTRDTDKIDRCVDKGGEWVRSYRRKNGSVVHGFCRRR